MRVSSRIAMSTFLINPTCTSVGSKGSAEDISAMSMPILGLMTGGSSREQHVDFKPDANSGAEDLLRAAETVCQLAMRQIPQDVELSEGLLTYPEGEVDAVTITQSDVEGLQPGRDISNNIVDFYIRFLERGLSPEHGSRFCFFNSFFFTKLLLSTAPSSIDPCKVDYEKLRNWTKEVNLFEKDYVFIPIVKSSHWSLVIICHLSSLTRPPGGTMRPPCVVHLDPIKGQHESFEGLIRSYVFQAWMERFQFSSNADQLLALCQMEYVEATVPEQDNLHDFGLHVLNYIDAFLLKSTSSDFSFPSNERGSHIISPHFVQEVWGKRMYIQNLIHELREISQKRARKRKAIQDFMQSTRNLRLFFPEGNAEADVQTPGPSRFSGQGYEITDASTDEVAIDAQHGQSTFILRLDDKPLAVPQIGHAGFENGSQSLSPEQQHVQPQVQTTQPIDFDGPNSKAKHASIHGDSIHVQHQQPCGISRLDCEPSDGLKLGHVEFQRETRSFSDKLQDAKLEETPCMELSKAQKVTNKRDRNMTDEETLVLLSCKREGGRFSKRSGSATNWDLISEEIGKKIRKEVGSLPSADQCRLRYDTLLKAYKTYKKYCTKTGKTFSEIEEAERLDLKLATTLSEEWYRTMDEICYKASVSQKRTKLSSPAPNPLAILGRSSEDEVVVLDSPSETIEVLLRNVDLKSTLMNLVQECRFFGAFLPLFNGERFDLKTICRRLAIVQDRESWEIFSYVLELWKLDFLNVVDMVFEERYNLAHIDFLGDKTWFLKTDVYKEVSKEVLGKNPHLQTYCNSFCFFFSHRGVFTSIY